MVDPRLVGPLLTTSVSFQVNRERLLQLPFHPVTVVLFSAVKFGLATSSIVFRHGSREDRKDEERNWKNHQRGITTQGDHVLQSTF